MIPTFVFPLLAAVGVGLLVVPPLIHLINMMRHKRVAWAAMDFLLQSHKRNKNYIWLKQLLLLLARMAALLLAGLMLAGMGCTSEMFAFLAGVPTHHYVIVDDSYSMADQSGSQTVYQRASDVATQIAESATSQQGDHVVTVLRTTRAALTLAEPRSASDRRATSTPAAEAANPITPDGASSEGTASAGRSRSSDAANPDAAGSDRVTSDATAGDLAGVADVLAEPLDGSLVSRIRDLGGRLSASALAFGPQAALEVVRAALAEPTQERSIVYVVSDFRQKDWDNPQATAAALAELRRRGAEVRLVRCADRPRGNLGIVAIRTEGNTLAAGVPLFVRVDVRNHGTEAVRAVQVRATTRTINPADETAERIDTLTGEVDRLPIEQIDEIAPGETATVRVQIYFPVPGRHVLEVRLPEDAVATDNVRHRVIDVPEGERVAMIAGDAAATDAYFLSAIFQPGRVGAGTATRAKTGILPETHNPAWLRDVAAEELDRFSAVYLLDVPRLDLTAIQKLETYVQGGGGVAIFLGPRTEPRVATEMLHRDGQGLLPFALTGQSSLEAPLGGPRLTSDQADGPAGGDAPGDVVPADHPIFEPFAGERNNLISLVRVNRFWRGPAAWNPEDDPAVRVAATLRNGSPLVLDKRLGDGRVLTFLTTAAPEWNTWARDPSFVVVTLMTQAYLASTRRASPERFVGAPLRVQLASEAYQPAVTFVVPDPLTGERSKIVRDAVRVTGGFLETGLAHGGVGARPDETVAPGVYELWLTTTQGRTEVRRYALAVEPSEGRLALAEPESLDPVLAEAQPTWLTFDEVSATLSERPQSRWGRWLLLGLVGLLLVEQVLAYSASFHPTKLFAPRRADRSMV